MWILCKDKLPEEGEYVLIFTGCAYDIARIEIGISAKERERMKRGEMEDPTQTGWTSSGVILLKRSEVYKIADQAFNNLVPYCFVTRSGQSIFGQNVYAWCPIPERCDTTGA